MSRLVVSDLHASYGRLRALHGVSFTVDAGKVTALLGPNGAGKTTVLRALCGSISTSGTVEFDGSVLTRRSPSAMARLGVAHVPEGRGTFADFTVLENLRLGGYCRDRLDEDIEQQFTWFPRLRERSRQLAGSLSGGEQQMLAIARALMLRPKVLLLDEPSQGLAPTITAAVYEILRSIQDSLGTTMLVVEQNAKVALRFADEAFVLETGRVVLSGPAAEVAGDVSVQRSYLGT
ncbi:ABC transporter ATP-binding protein [Desertimonas flava]|uniref:ABC transporter ATP-binding protein n=1 Tax=Desertimonas flava TaxID=2064846 RepID=UPI000E34D9BC|nr:ABC transporter ATP-binding protein [Desertimonas flava]